MILTLPLKGIGKGLSTAFHSRATPQGVFCVRFLLFLVFFSCKWVYCLKQADLVAHYIFLQLIPYVLCYLFLVLSYCIYIVSLCT